MVKRRKGCNFEQIFINMNLPEDFLHSISSVIPSEEYDAFVKSLCEEEQTTSIRLNASKISREEAEAHFVNATKVGWCDEGRYLSERPQFTLDPLLHAGAYYVQEASSMFITHVIRHLIKEPVTCLDLCASPGGKSTAAISAMPKDSQIVSNEIDRRRARILAENITKWGFPDVTVTCNAPKDFKSLRHTFDLIITDVPCSGEGMFRKDEGALADWSLAKVKGCTSLQHEIIDDIWDCLKPGGLLIYSTCTFNIDEDERMIEYICDSLGGKALEVPVEEAWNIHKPLIGNNPCYRFMPHFTKGEGLFMAVIRKDDGDVMLTKARKHQKNMIKVENDIRSWVTTDVVLEQNKEGVISAISTAHKELHDAIVGSELFVLQSGVELGIVKGKDIIPSHNLALSTILSDKAFARYEVDMPTALDYLRRQTLILPADAPKGFVILTYRQHPLGFVKNLGNRCNNLYPQEWRIRKI